MQINIFFLATVIVIVVFFLAWLIYSNLKDEKKFEKNLDIGQEWEAGKIKRK